MIHHRTLNALEYGKIVNYLADLCVTTAGRKMAKALAPLPDAEKASEALHLYEENRNFSETPASASFHVSAAPDISGIIELASDTMDGARRGVSLDLDAFWALRETLTQAFQALAALRAPAGEKSWPRLWKMAHEQDFPETLFSALNRCISDDGQIRDDATPELGRIRQELRRLHQTCLRQVKDYAQKYNIQHYLQDDFMTIASDRYVLPLKANFKGRLQGIIHDWSQTGETCYFEPIFLVEINNRLAGLKREEHQEERQILNYLTALLVDNLALVASARDILGLLDFLNAKKLLALYLECETLAFTSPDAGIDLIEARHPLLALAAQAKQLSGNTTKPRPLNIRLEPGQRALVITGGNAGGKTVCLKTLGLIAAMAMSGLPVTVAKGSHLPWFDRLDAFIGDEQSLDDQVSTFTAQMEHLAKAWKHLDDRGLVLLDEFGAGTDPAEGAALAQAVLDGLLEKQCFALCATHFPALKSYALTHEAVAAASMLFNPETHKPLYKLAYGQVGSSQALEVARECGLADSLINRARHYLLQDGQDSSAILGRLNDLAAVREREIEELKKERQKSKIQLEEKKASLQKEREHLQTELKSRMGEIMRAFKEEKITARQALKNLGGLREELGLESSTHAALLPRPSVFTAGSRIFHKSFNRSGVISEVDERRRKARVDMDGVSLWANFEDLYESPTAANTKSQPAPRINAERAGLTLDLRGKRADEALASLEAFLDKALLSGYSEVEIIHGRGTGALRKQVHAFLHSYPAISAYVLAPEDRGGDGMTIVNFR